jgi:hypothetical protein
MSGEVVLHVATAVNAEHESGNAERDQDDRGDIPTEFKQPSHCASLTRERSALRE